MVHPPILCIVDYEDEEIYRHHGEDTDDGYLDTVHHDESMYINICLCCE